MRKNTGFALLSAVFIIAILSAISAYVLNIAAVARSTTAYALQGQRAYFAAKSGLNWSIYEVINSPTVCPATTTFNFTQGGLKGFSVQVTCSVTAFTEGTTARNLFVLTGVATKGSFGSADYVSRQSQVVVTL